MIILLILATFIFAVMFDIFVVQYIRNRKKTDKKDKLFFEDIFYSPTIGFTMRDGGEPMKKDDKLTKQ